jgi:hypothetical protein
MNPVGLSIARLPSPRSADSDDAERGADAGLGPAIDPATKTLSNKV